MRHSLLLGFLVLASGTEVVSAPPGEWKLSKAVGQKWVARVKALARDGWTVELRGNDIIVRRSKSVAMERIVPNAPLNGKPMPDGERAIQFVLRFAPKMSMDEYERLAAVNAASDKEYHRLHSAVGLPHKFDDFIATTAAEKKRVEEFRAAVAKLPRHDLPDLYTPDHSIYFLHPWDGWSSPADKAVASQCRDVEETLLRFFGKYDPAAAAGKYQVGHHLGTEGK
jgi:hypothetical protein